MVRALALALLFSSVCAQAAPQNLLTAHGIATLKIGMTQNQLEEVLKRKLDANGDSSDDAQACQEARVPGMPGVYLLLEHYRISRIDVDGGLKGAHTAEGVHVGMTEGEVRRIFGKRAIFTPRPYEGDVEGAHDIVVKVGATREFIFETEGGKVESMRIGDLPAAEYMEGCA